MRVEMKNLSKHFGRVKAVNDFSVILNDGELVCLLGPSGCGKSTVLNMLSGILPVTGGKIYFDDEDVTDLPPEQRGIGLVFQNYALYPHMTVLGNICFPLEIQGLPKAERIQRATEMAELVHMEGMLHRKPKELSGGQQQRVAIARAVVANPDLILADEPTGNLDSKNGAEVMSLLTELNREGTTIVMVTHSMHDAGYAGRTINLFDGRVVPEAVL